MRSGSKFSLGSKK